MKQTKRKDRGRRETKLANQLLSFLNKHTGQTFSAKHLSRQLKVKAKRRIALVEDTLETLIITGTVKKIGDEYTSTHEASTLEGVVDFVNPRFAFIVCEGQDKDIKVSALNLATAQHDDRVKISVFPTRHGPNPEGKVVEIVERKRDEFAGLLEISGEFGFVVADNRKMHTDIFIPKERIGKAQHGDKVVAKVLEWGKKGKNPLGKITKILGEAGSHQAEMHAIMYEFDLPMEFPQTVLDESERIPSEISAEEIANRRDYRSVPTFTIDPVDAKDFDDALSIFKMDNGNYEVGIHIADVTHYVQPKSQLEKEAFRRATSVYLVDRVVPMLPERLSNGLCSLRPNEDKLTFSAIFELTPEAHVVNQWFGRTITHSNRRFTYEDAQEIIKGAEGDYKEEILTLNDLAFKLRDQRFKEGSIAFESPEVRFKLDEEGAPIELVTKIRFEAHKLVEDFMLLANKKVAEFVYKLGKGNHTMVYRTHDDPDMMKLEAFGRFAGKFGLKFMPDQNGLSNALNEIMTTIEGKPEGDVLQPLAIRAMAKAKYTTEGTQHFGLGFEHYTHFTSPIRRYPDMMVHRLLQHYLDNKKSPDKEDWESKCEHSSGQEKMAADAERASIKYKQVEFMSNEVGKAFEGVVAGVTEWGLFVEITATKCEGMVRVSDLNDDYYEYDADNLALIGTHNKRMIAFGDKVTVRVTGTDLQSRTIDLELLNEGEE